MTSMRGSQYLAAVMRCTTDQRMYAILAPHLLPFMRAQHQRYLECYAQLLAFGG
jgi:hypothetical protein